MCSSFDEFLFNHAGAIKSWAERVEVEEQMTNNKAEIEQMLKNRNQPEQVQHAQRVMKFVCRCPAVCSSFDEFFRKHAETIKNWADRVEIEEQIMESKAEIEQMLKGEPYARIRRAIREKKRAAGYIPPPQVRCKGLKPVCNKCELDSAGNIVKNNCHNKKCTFVHGKFDNREYVRQQYC